MTPAKQLRLAVESCELQHALFAEHLKPLMQRVEEAMEGGASRTERVLGPSRVGKSMLINALKRPFGETKVENRRRIPLLVVPVPTPVSPALLPLSVLNALGTPVVARTTTGTLGYRMLDQLRLAGTRVIIFDEASHLVEPGARVPPRAAGDWFKALQDANITLLLMGVPRLERLFEHNEQLRMRSSAARFFLPYDSRRPEHMRAFHACVSSYANLFRDNGYPIELPASALTYQCYLLSGGLVGVLSRFMQELASQMAYEAPRTLTFADCQAAAHAIEAAGPAHLRAFASPDAVLADVAPPVLHQVFVQVFHDHDIQVPVMRQSSGDVA